MYPRIRARKHGTDTTDTVTVGRKPRTHMQQEGADGMAFDDNAEMTEATEAPAAPPTAAAAAAAAASVAASASTTAAASAANEPPPEADAATEKRRAIQSIMRDEALSEVDKRMRIQALMDGSTDPASAAAGTEGTGGGQCIPVPTTAASALDDGWAISCVHYERRCNIVAPCCGKEFGCRVCHDEMTPPPGHGPMDRFAVREIVCKECRTRQPASNRCVNNVLGTCPVDRFGEYHCSICNLWMVQSKRPFHCPDCGFCRVGGRDQFRHCSTCSMCISVNVYADHSCMKDKYKNNCPVCREDMFSSRQSPQDLPCGHAIHAHCFRKLAGFDYRCPICKKTVVSHQSMAAAWATRARDIEMQPMPPDLARIVHIMCNDCETRSPDRDWHFLGVQCPHCTSFNTVVEQVVSSGEGAAGVEG